MASQLSKLSTYIPTYLASQLGKYHYQLQLSEKKHPLAVGTIHFHFHKIFIASALVQPVINSIGSNFCSTCVLNKIQLACSIQLASQLPVAIARQGFIRCGAVCRRLATSKLTSAKLVSYNSKSSLLEFMNQHYPSAVCPATFP